MYRLICLHAVARPFILSQSDCVSMNSPNGILWYSAAPLGVIDPEI